MYVMYWLCIIHRRYGMHAILYIYRLVDSSSVYPSQRATQADRQKGRRMDGWMDGLDGCQRGKGRLSVCLFVFLSYVCMFVCVYGMHRSPDVYRRLPIVPSFVQPTSYPTSYPSYPPACLSTCAENTVHHHCLLPTYLPTWPIMHTTGFVSPAGSVS